VLIRADLGIALSSGRNLHWTWSSWDQSEANKRTTTHFSSTKEHRTQFFSHLEWLDVMDARLVNIWQDLKSFSDYTNTGLNAGKTKMNPESFQHTLVSLEYNLMSLKFPVDNVNEAFRLGMAAFAATIFLQTHGIRVRFPDLAGQLHNVLLQANLSGREFVGLRVWIYVMARLSAVTDVDDGWLLPLLRNSLESAHVGTWEAVRSVCKEFLWLDFLHEADGITVFDKVLSLVS
jgi:hypothetical protein